MTHTRVLTLACGQLGGVQPDEPRSSVVARMVALMREARKRGARLIAFPELALTTFFPRYVIEEADLDRWFEKEMPSAETQPLFTVAADLGIGFSLGFAEITKSGKRYNSAVLVDDKGAVASHYRKIHLPGEDRPQPNRRFQHLEKLYFAVGTLGFPVVEVVGFRIGLALCNDRRWTETYRLLALAGADLVLIGYNTPLEPELYPADARLSALQHRLSLQAGAHLNALWVAGIAKTGSEDEAELLGGTMIASPTGEVVAEHVSRGDEVVMADCDLAAAIPYRSDLFDFDRHRRIEAYGPIASQRGVVMQKPRMATAASLFHDSD